MNNNKTYNITDVMSQTNNIMDFDYFHLTIHLTEGCNYKCTYCYGQEPIGKDNFIPLDTIKSVIKQVFDLNKTNYNISILGGEVTYIPIFLDIIEYINSFNKNVNIIIMTNGSRNIEYFKKLLSYKNISIILSIHLEYMNEKTFSNIKDIIKLSNEYGYYHNSIFMMPQPIMKDKFIYYTNLLLEYRKEYNFNLSFTEIVAPPDFTHIDPRYDQDYLNLIQDFRDKFNNIVNEYGIIDINMNHKIQFISKLPQAYYIIKTDDGKLKKLYIDKDIDTSEALAIGLKQFKDFYCIGNNYLNIMSNGDYYSTECQLMKAGNIYDGPIDFVKLSSPMKCTRDNCGCRSDILSSKFRTLEEGKSFHNKYLISIINNINNLDIIYRIAMSIDINKNDKHLEEKINSISSYNIFKVIKFIKSQNDEKIDELYHISNEYNNRFIKLVNAIVWWIPVKKWRDNFRNKILNI